MSGEKVGIVIVSHSDKIAQGTVEMIRQMVGDDVPIGWSGGDKDGGLGSNAEGIARAIEEAWSPCGVLVLYDIGGAETNAEMAIEMLDADRRDKVVLCDAPLVEGAFMAAVESSGGALVKEVMEAARGASDKS